LVAYRNTTRRAQPGAIGPNGVPVRVAPSPNSQRLKAKTREATRRQAMLNTHRLTPFKYDMNEILSGTQMDEAKSSGFLATLIAKASRQSTKEAKDFARTFLDAGDLTKDDFDRICRLLDKYSKYR
jgi:hypothetical protein